VLDNGGSAFNARHRRFGLDGTGDASEGLLDLITAACAARRPADLDGLTHTLTAQIAIPSNFELINGALDVTALGVTSPFITTGGGVEADRTLTADALFGDTQIEVDDTTDLTEGDTLIIKSTRGWNVAGTVKLSQMVTVKEVLDANNIEIYGQIQYNFYLIDPLDAMVSYTVTAAKITFVENWNLRNVTLIGDSGTAGSNGLNLQYIKDSTFTNIRGDGFRGRLLQLRTGYNCEVRNNAPRKSDPLINGGLNYGLSIVEGCHYIRMPTGYGRNARHIGTIGGSTWVNRFIDFGIIQGEDMTDACIDAHPAADIVTIKRVSTSFRPGGACEAVIFQGARLKLGMAHSVGSGGFAVVRCQPFIAADVPVHFKIGSAIGDGDFDRIVQIDQQGTTPVRRVSIDEATHISGSGTCEVVVDIRADEGDIENVRVKEFSGVGITDRGAYVRAENSASINGVQLAPGVVRMAGGSNSCIRIQSGVSSSVTDVYVEEGGILDGGVYGVNAPDATTSGVHLGRQSYANQTTAPFNIQAASSRADQGDGIGALGNADATLRVGYNEPNQICSTPLTANRAITLNTTGATLGAWFLTTRTAASTGAFNLTVSGKALTPGTWCKHVFDGSAWVLQQAGSL
jgi:hypothetical protein